MTEALHSADLAPTPAERAGHAPDRPAPRDAHGHARSLVAHHFDDLEQQHEASRLGMWTFLVTEVLFFGGLFCAYVVYRSAYPAAFAAGSRTLDLWAGGFNTAVLIGSSLSMALAVAAAHDGDRRALIRNLLLTILLGAVFLGVKVYEYAHKFEEGHVPGPYFRFSDGLLPDRAEPLFFGLYFAMTGLHAVHMIIGIGILAVLAGLAHLRRIGPDWWMPVELTGLYWHFVDVVWIFLFPLLYLIDRHV